MTHHIAASQVLFFAATVFVVFGAGTLAPRLAARIGAASTSVLGLAVTLAAGVALAASAAPTFAFYVVAVCIFLFGMGLVSPVATAMALGPFGDRAGLASALLGFIQMASAAAGSSIVMGLALPRTQSLGLVFAGAALLGVVVNCPGARRGCRRSCDPAPAWVTAAQIPE